MPAAKPRGGSGTRARGAAVRGRGGGSVRGRATAASPGDDNTASTEPTTIASEATPSAGANESSGVSTTNPTRSEAVPAATQTTPAHATMAPSVAPASSSSARGGKKIILAQPKFAGRRSKAEREAAAASQEAKRAEEARNQRANQDRRGGLRGGRGGNRGGFMGDFRKKESLAAATGVFGSGVVSAEFSQGRRGPSRATGGPAGASSGPPPAGGSAGRRVRIKSEGGDESGEGIWVEVSSDESDEDAREGPKRNIDYIDLRSDDEENQDSGKTPGPSGSRGMQPVRVQRIERKDRNQPSVAKSSKVDRKRAIRDLESSSVDALSKGKQRAKDGEESTSEHKWKGVYDDDQDNDAGANIKTEPVTGEGIAPHPLPEAHHPSSPEDRKHRSRKHSGPDLQTEEEREEHARHLSDLDTIAHELGRTAITPPDADGDTPMADTSDAAAAKDDPRAYKVYLFQFPPILPDLRTNAETVGKPDPATTSSPTLSKVTPAPAPAAAPDAAAAAPEVKPEPDDAGDAAKPDLSAAAAARGGAQLSSGRVGKLRVHASGRVTLDWAGTSLAVGMGTEVDFLQQVVMAKVWDDERMEKHISPGAASRVGAREAPPPPEKSDIKQPDGMVGGEVMALGQVRGKFVVTPDWEEII